jgi:hypothetical protein
MLDHEKWIAGTAPAPAMSMISMSMYARCHQMMMIIATTSSSFHFMVQARDMEFSRCRCDAGGDELDDGGRGTWRQVEEVNTMLKVH